VKTTVFWDVVPRNVIWVTDVTGVLAASVIMAVNDLLPR
jgi:hypothetical protein